MASFSCRDITVEKCGDCQGIWFRRGGFAVFCNALQEFDLAELRLLERTQPEGIESIPACPQCAEPLSSFRYAYNSKVTLNKCASCNGVWLPFSELLDLVDLTSVGQYIAPHLKGAVDEMNKLNAERRRNRTTIQFLLELVKPVSPRWWRYAKITLAIARSPSCESERKTLWAPDC